MTYSAGEILFLTRLQAMSQFDSSNSARGKWNLLNSGNSSQYAILRKGPEVRTKISPNTRAIVYTTVIELWQRYTDDGTSYTTLLTLENAVKAELDKYRVMGDATNSVIKANIVAVGDYLEVKRENMWIKVDLIGEWHEETSISYSE